jgi:hypothetical protein
VIPVAPQPEPDQFESLVRLPGSAYLATVPAPTTAQWKKAAFWTRIAGDFRVSYGAICAYSAQWIPYREGGGTVDHYVPKSDAPQLAYEWTNYRLACQNCNARKWVHRDVLDPFNLAADSFVLLFPGLQVGPNDSLPAGAASAVDATIERLRLNDENAKTSRQEWLLPYCENQCTFELLRERAPFIAHELERQGLVEEIKRMMVGRTRHV